MKTSEVVKISEVVKTSTARGRVLPGRFQITLRLEVDAPDRTAASKMANRLSVDLAERYGLAALGGEVEPATREWWSPPSVRRARRAGRDPRARPARP